MLYKNMFIKIIIIAVICITINSTLIYAIAEENIDTTSIVKVTDAQYTSIEKILAYINKEIKNIDEKISISRTLTEYKKYPAVRLNIDTPYFGIYSIINSKLKIRNGVSTVDIASGYSIKSVVNKKSIKIESFEVSSIVVITRDVKIDKNMTLTDAQTCIFKLLGYLQQTKSVNKFLDKQLLSMITGYFSNEKDKAISSINEQIEQIEENLNLSLIELSYIKATTENDTTEDTNVLYKYKEEILSIKSKIKSVLINQTNLDEIYEKILKTNDDIKLFRFNVNKKYLEVSSTINLEKAAYLINLKMNNEMTYLQSYIDNSKIEIVDQTGDNTPEVENTVESINVQSNKIIAETKEKKYEQMYKIASETIIQNMEKDVKNVSEIFDKVVKNNLITDEKTLNKEKLNSELIVNQLLQIYIGFLNKENVFLTENAKINITEIKKSNDLNITSFENVEYIYINLSDVLTRISDSFVSNSVISNTNTADSLKQVINKVILCGKEFKKTDSAIN
ncbi:MAG: hypothetical protein PHD15_03505 [Clostridia bacterium]|nr:hypothetical protein [Clostridia bacterium]MDD4386808.1 hypothetical protein [Clostridia bacterium]